MGGLHGHLEACDVWACYCLGPCLDSCLVSVLMSMVVTPPKPYGCPQFGPPPEAMLMSRGHAATGAILISVACAAMVTSESELSQGPCLGP